MNYDKVKMDESPPRTPAARGDPREREPTASVQRSLFVYYATALVLLLSPSSDFNARYLVSNVDLSGFFTRFDQ